MAEDFKKEMAAAAEIVSVEEIAQMLVDALRKAGKTMAMGDIMESAREIAAETTQKSEVQEYINQALS